MSLYEFEGKRPAIGDGTYVSETADVIGDVVIGARCYIGPGAKIKGDYGSVRIGDETSVQENCVVHARPDDRCTVGKRVNVGHGAILHNCTIHDFAVIGMGAIVSDFAVVGEWCAIGEGCVVKSGQEISPGKVAVGVPAKITGDVTAEYKELWGKYKLLYVGLAQRYKNLKKIG
jgi:carbonic anhydrase/acetyltransferase-like protein (isoleucine patch superfamily)